MLYGGAYLLIAKALVVDQAAQFGRLGPLPHLVIAPRLALGWTDPAFVLYATDAVVLAPSLPAILTVLVLGALVAANSALAVETAARRPAACATKGGWSALAVLPSFLASFSCCAPTILLLLGAGAAGAVVSAIPYAVPVAAGLLLLSLWLGARRLGTVSPSYRMPGGGAVTGRSTGAWRRP